jgi:hypothetical protein
VRIEDIGLVLEPLSGTRRTTRDGRTEWRYHGRLVARQLDGEHLVIRVEFAVRDAITRQRPETFSVPSRFQKHMMVVADLANGDEQAIEDALVAAWGLQRRAD